MAAAELVKQLALGRNDADTSPIFVEVDGQTFRFSREDLDFKVRELLANAETSAERGASGRRTGADHTNRPNTERPASVIFREVIREARKRSAVLYRFQLLLAIALSLILLVGVMGAIISGLLYGEDVWAAAFGGVSLADLIGIYIFKPVNAVMQAHVAIQRIDVAYVRNQEQLASCALFPDLAARIACQNEAWDRLLSELGSASTPTRR